MLWQTLSGARWAYAKVKNGEFLRKVLVKEKSLAVSGLVKFWHTWQFNNKVLVKGSYQSIYFKGVHVVCYLWLYTTNYFNRELGLVHGKPERKIQPPAASSLPKASKRNSHSKRIPHQPLQNEFVFCLLLEECLRRDWLKLTLSQSAMTANTTNFSNTLYHCRSWHRKNKLLRGVAGGRKAHPDLLQHMGIHHCPALRIICTGIDPLLALCRPQIILPISQCSCHTFSQLIFHLFHISA